MALYLLLHNTIRQMRANVSIIYKTADLWSHTLVMMLSILNIYPHIALNELECNFGLSGYVEKADHSLSK